MANSNVLSKRYATKPINDMFSDEGTITAERDLWIAVMKAQRELGLDIPAGDISKFEAAKNDVNLQLINEIEERTRHDVNAKIEAFVRTAGAGEYLHWGMTSRDLTDNVEQMQIRRAAKIIFGKYVSVLRHLGDKAREYRDIVLTARTHHQASQPTLLGRRMSMWAEELLYHERGFESFIQGYPLRGIKGPVGTQFDMLTLLGSQEKVEVLEKRIAELLGFTTTLSSPGQVYPRSLDYQLLSNLALLSAGCENFATGMRLMAGYELATEGFKEGQVGSSAMPHKRNTRSSERICAFGKLLKMYAEGASRLSGDQWEEGDVSCSAVRRVIIPDAFYVSDGLCETTLTVLNEMGIYPAVIDRETDRYLPFLATTEILMTAVQAGIGRETAHKIIRRHSVGEALRMSKEGAETNMLADLLSKDPAFAQAGVTRATIDGILSDKAHFVGNARQQINMICEGIGVLADKYPTEARYEPEKIL